MLTERGGPVAGRGRDADAVWTKGAFCPAVPVAGNLLF
ncbi:MAG: hypothetical protein AVDCRST_MAG56-2314 [uncultured Cytophagales bacterium]|uniref:Uncharacterized protein n=1 Tax=uncultured Cytophagales bacterium TaxID=158755 RepID=A0A6J4IN12_9SPHI|nr:MAG: hypothetical protein AVDCRST_MAG56-2314 [uncultured Cytophagales bacterium]